MATTLVGERSSQEAAPKAAPRSKRARGGTRTLSLNPMTRVGGALGVRMEVGDDRISDAFAFGTMFRGYENIITGRDPRDALHVASRVCGWCGAVHMTTSAMALEMAWGLEPPPMAVAMRNIAECTEAIWIHAAHLAVRVGPDFSAPVVARTTPHIWKMAQSSLAPGAALHGYRTIADIMEGMVPLTGRYWVETIPAGRRVQEMISFLYGKYPHPSVMTPGGLAQTLTIGSFTEYFTNLYLSVDYVKLVLALWDDIIDFMYEADPRFETLGERPASFIHAGCWGNFRSSNRFENLDEAGRARLASPGVMIDGKLVTGSLTEVHAGIEEDVSRAFYQSWAGGSVTDPVGNTLSPNHPWNKRTIPAPQAPSATGPYSWSTAPRWRGEVLETTPLGRLWMASIRDDFPANEFIHPTGKSLKIIVPLNYYPETIVEWKIPERNNALERIRADAYGIAFAGLSAAIALLAGFELTRTGETDRSVPFGVTREPSAGVGLWESGRGMNIHWISMDKGRVSNYQVLGPSTWNASPRDGAGNPGPMEQALINSPIIEEPVDGLISGIDAMRIVHSFDPCMNCAVH